MANCAYLINSSSVLTAWDENGEPITNQPDAVYGCVAESANRLSIPWLLCFRASDLRPVKRGAEPAVQEPFTTVAQAVARMAQSLPVFEAITGDAAVAHGYWQLACASLKQLPLPCLSMSAGEVFDIGGIDEQAFRQALMGGIEAVPALTALVEYDADHRAYPLDGLFNMPMGPRNASVRNASLLDGGFTSPPLHWHRRGAGAAPADPPPLPIAFYGELSDVSGLLDRLVREALPNMAGTAFGLAGEGRKDGIFYAHVYVKKAADLASLRAHAPLHRQLDALVTERLAPWGAKYGFAWQGFDFSMPAWAAGT